MVSASRSPSQSSSLRTATRLLSAVAILLASVAAGYLLLPHPLADVFVAAWVLGSVGLSLVGGIGVWTNRTPLVWVAALLLAGISILGMMSIGLFIAPAAVCLLGAALLLQRAGPQEEDREANSAESHRKTTSAESQTVRTTVLKTLAGTGSVAVGIWLVYVSALVRDLFGACAAETLACVLSRTHWSRVGTAVLGATAVGLGGWLLWKQVSIVRVRGTKGLRR